MAENINNTISTKVELDVNQAQQQIVKLNAVASDSTESLTTRVDAKNKAIKIQNDLNKKTISDLEKQVKSLEGVVGSEKELERTKKKLNKARLNEVKVNVKNEKQQKKVTASLKSSKSATDNLNKATGGFLEKLKLLAGNPIVLIITALVGALTLLQKAFVSSEEGQDKWAKGMAVIGTVVGNVMDLFHDFANVVVDAIAEPGKAWDGFVEKLQQGYNFIKQQVIDRFLGSWNVLSGNFQSGVLKMRIAWNEFTGDAEEAQSLTDELEKVNDKIAEGAELLKNANGEIVALYNDAKQAVSDFIAEQEKEIVQAQKIADKRALADRVERDLIVSRAKANRDRAAALEKAVDKENYSTQERIKFLKEAGEIEEEITEKELAAARLRLAAKAEENTLSQSTKQDLKEEAELRAKIIDLETAKLKKQRAVTAQTQAVLAEQKAKNAADKAKQDAIDKKKEEDDEKTRLKNLDNASIDRQSQIEIDELEIERKKELGLRTLEDELALLEAKRIQDITQEGLRASELKAINAKYDAEKRKINAVSVKTEKEKDDAIFDSQLKMAGDAFGVSQELAVAKMLMNAPEAVGNVWSQAAKQPTIPQMLLHGAIGTATTLAPIVQGLNTIKQTRFAGKSGGATGGTINTAGAGGGGGLPTATSTEITDLSSIDSARSGINSSIGDQASSTAANNVMGGASGKVVFSESSYSDFKNQVQFKEDKSTL